VSSIPTNTIVCLLIESPNCFSCSTCAKILALLGLFRICWLCMLLVVLVFRTTAFIVPAGSSFCRRRPISRAFTIDNIRNDKNLIVHYIPKSFIILCFDMNVFNSTKHICYIIFITHLFVVSLDVDCYTLISKLDYLSGYLFISEAVHCNIQFFEY
jgi:hypothetical protein